MDRARLMQLHDELTAECREIMRRKNEDYSSGSDPFENFKAASLLGVAPESGLLLRVLDKVMRLKTFINTGTLSVTDEPAADAIKDIINYMVLLAGLMESGNSSQACLREHPSLGKDAPRRRRASSPSF